MTEPTADPFAFLRGLTADQLDAIEATNRAILDAIERYRATVPQRRPRARPSPPPAAHPCDVYPLEWRPDYDGRGGVARAVAWFVWGDGRGGRWYPLRRPG